MKKKVKKPATLPLYRLHPQDKFKIEDWEYLLIHHQPSGSSVRIKQTHEGINSKGEPTTRTAYSEPFIISSGSEVILYVPQP